MKKIYLGLLVVLVLLSTALFYINIKMPVKIALVGNFNEERYAFATSSIIGGRIAEDEINTQIGIRGKRTELIVKEDKFDNPKKTIKFLKDNKIEAIITTASSQELLKLKPLLDENKIACIAVGATSANLSGIDDYIFRVFPDDNKETKVFAKYLDKVGISKEIILIYDKSNIEYKKSIEKSIEEQGVKILFQESWDSDSLKYSPSNLSAIKDKPILILSSARHTAFIVQKLRKEGVTSNIFGMSWSGDDHLLSYGGRTVEDFTLISPVDFSESNSAKGSYLEKLKEYRKKNGLVSNGVYNAYHIIKKAYEDRQEQHITLKEALNKCNNFDEYGDSKGSEIILKIKNGQYTRVEGRDYESAQK